MTNDLNITYDVVVVDDDESFRDLLTILFGRQERFRVVADAASGEEALAVIARTEPDLVVLDNHLEGELTGIDVARRLRAERPDVKLLMLVAATGPVEASGVDVDAIVDKMDFRAVSDVARRVVGADSPSGPRMLCTKCATPIDLQQVHIDADTGSREVSCPSCRATLVWRIGEEPRVTR